MMIDRVTAAFMLADGLLGNILLSLVNEAMLNGPPQMTGRIFFTAAAIGITSAVVIIRVMDRYDAVWRADELRAAAVKWKRKRTRRLRPATVRERVLDL